MERLRAGGLPLALWLVQVGVWPGHPLATGRPVDPRSAVTVVVVAALAAAVLSGRRRAPVSTLVAVTTVVAVGAHLVDRQQDLLISLLPAVAVFSVAVRRSGRVTALSTLALVVCYAPVARNSTGLEFTVDLMGDSSVWLVAVALGLARRRWSTDRRAAADRLARAEADRRRAVADERQRLARELHDTAAHHLTAVVVGAGVADRLAGTRPDLADEALASVASSGQQALVALRRLVAVVGGGGPAEEGPPLHVRVEALAAEFARLGQAVTVSTTGAGAVPAPVVETGYAVVRESLTNALRYAPGAPVTVSIGYRPGTLAVTVTDGGRSGSADPGAPTGGRLGSGYGLTGIRERTDLLGGTLTAGPRPGGGWKVHAELPVTPSRPRRMPVRDRLVDAVLAFLVAWLPPMVVATAVTAQGPVAMRRPQVLPVLAGLLLVHAVPLVWRRRAPWAVLVAVLAATLLWPVAARWAGLPGFALLILWFAVGVEAVAVYTVARCSPRPTVSWLSVPLSVVVVALAAVLTAAQDGVVDGEVLTGANVVGVARSIMVLVVVVFGLPWSVAWGVGAAVRLRHRRVHGAERAALERVAAQTRTAAAAERARIAHGLRYGVLTRVGRLAGVEGGGPSPAVVGGRTESAARTTEARAALAAMRELLGSLRAGPAVDPPGRSGVADLTGPATGPTGLVGVAAAVRSPEVAPSTSE